MLSRLYYWETCIILKLARKPPPADCNQIESGAISIPQIPASFYPAIVYFLQNATRNGFPAVILWHPAKFTPKPRFCTPRLPRYAPAAQSPSGITRLMVFLRRRFSSVDFQGPYGTESPSASACLLASRCARSS